MSTLPPSTFHPSHRLHGEFRKPSTQVGKARRTCRTLSQTAGTFAIWPLGCKVINVGSLPNGFTRLQPYLELMLALAEVRCSDSQIRSFKSSLSSKGITSIWSPAPPQKTSFKVPHGGTSLWLPPPFAAVPAKLPCIAALAEMGRACAAFVRMPKYLAAAELPTLLAGDFNHHLPKWPILQEAITSGHLHNLLPDALVEDLEATTEGRPGKVIDGWYGNKEARAIVRGGVVDPWVGFHPHYAVGIYIAWPHAGAPPLKVHIPDKLALPTNPQHDQQTAPTTEPHREDWYRQWSETWEGYLLHLDQSGTIASSMFGRGQGIKVTPLVSKNCTQTYSPIPGLVRPRTHPERWRQPTDRHK
eukprot:817987-Amphidinium_carterae.2